MLCRRRDGALPRSRRCGRWAPFNGTSRALRCGNPSLISWLWVGVRPCAKPREGEMPHKHATDRKRDDDAPPENWIPSQHRIHASPENQSEILVIALKDFFSIRIARVSTWVAAVVFADVLADFE